MFSKLFEKKIEIVSPVSGTVYPIEEVNDPVFSSKSAGDGFAIHHNTEKNVYSPIDGTVTVVASSKHAIFICQNDLELLMHIGIETVNLKGKHFTSKVQVGQKVKKGDLLFEVEFDEIRKKEIDTDIVIILNKPLEKVNYGKIEKLQKVLEIKER